MNIHVVEQGDNVDDIANLYGVSVDSIIYINQLVCPYALAIGQALLIEDDIGTNACGMGVQTKQVLSGGYAYPFIESYVLEETLPFLTELYVFSYGFTQYGRLLPPEISDENMLKHAKAKGVNPILTLTPFGEDGNFNNQLIHQIVTNPQAKARLFHELLDLIPKKGYDGVDVDFEFILEEDRDRFTAFVEELTILMNEHGWRVSVALAPKTSATQGGLLYAGKDYAALGRVSNQVLIMTYEWGYTYGPPMAVAPINKVREVVEYAVSEIVSEKISLGIPNYGYDWTLPFVQGTSMARTIGNVEAVQIAVKFEATIQFDELAQTPYFYYSSEGYDHVVWFEDVRSICAKFELVKEYKMLGMVYWQLMRLFLANWYLLEDTFFIR